MKSQNVYKIQKKSIVRRSASERQPVPLLGFASAAWALPIRSNDPDGAKAGTVSPSARWVDCAEGDWEGPSGGREQAAIDRYISQSISAEIENQMFTSKVK